MAIPHSARTLVAGVLLTALSALTACSATDDSQHRPPSSSGACPVAPVDVVVSVDQWGDIVAQLGGACAEVRTLLASSSANPHDYEPSPADAAGFSGARLVVINGGHYDEWASKLAAGSAPDARVISAVTDDQRRNPHVWYDPATVHEVAGRIRAALSKLSPGAADYFARQYDSFMASLQPYDELIAAIRVGVDGRTYVATEAVFDDMAAAVGLVNRTPAGYAAAARNETDPSPADLNAMLTLLRDRDVDVLIYNSSTEGSGPRQIRDAALAAGIPVVDVTETVAPGAGSFQAWQVAQLSSLARTLGVDV